MSIFFAGTTLKSFDLLPACILLGLIV
jgi:hypothetical protein